MPRVLSHTPEKIHICREGCDASFIRKPDRDRHEKVHKPYDERKFACSFEGCNFRANQSSGLKCHISSVHEKARISCPFPGCNEDYSDPSSLTRHKKKCHSGSCPPDRPKRNAELSGAPSSSSRHPTMMTNSRSEFPHHPNGCCACHCVKLESATSDLMGHSVLHTKSSSVMKPDFPNLCLPDATLQAFTPTSDLENQLLGAMPSFHMNQNIPVSNHFMSGDGGVNRSTTSFPPPPPGLLLYKSVFDSNPAMSQYATNYNTPTLQPSRFMPNPSHESHLSAMAVPPGPRSISTAASFAAAQPPYDMASYPNYDVNFNCPGPSTNASQMQGQYRVNVPPLKFDHSSYSQWLTDAELITEAMFSS